MDHFYTIESYYLNFSFQLGRFGAPFIKCRGIECFSDRNRSTDIAIGLEHSNGTTTTAPSRRCMLVVPWILRISEGLNRPVIV